MPDEHVAAITVDQLRYIMPTLTLSRIATYLRPMNDAMNEGQINTPVRMASFLAQVAHESGELKFWREIASGTAYEDRKDLGNVNKGDGVRFVGRGPISLTGRFNYGKCGQALGIDLVSHPDIVETPSVGFRTSVWFWRTRGLNELADVGDFDKITRRINGGTNGQDSRRNYHVRARSILGADVCEASP